MLLCAPLRPRGASARPLFGFHVRLSRVSAYMVRRAVSARVEDHVRGYAKFSGGGDASDHPAGDGGDRLPLPQYPRIQSEATGRSLPEGGPAGRVIIADRSAFFSPANFSSLFFSRRRMHARDITVSRPRVHEGKYRLQLRRTRTLALHIRFDQVACLFEREVRDTRKGAICDIVSSDQIHSREEISPRMKMHVAFKREYGY